MLTKIIEEDRLQKAKTLIEKGEKFVIVTHVSPDGDAIGSSLGMLHFLHALGKENVSVIVPNEFPTFYHWMPGASEVLIYEYHSEQCETLLKEADVLFCLDFNEPKRIEKLAPAVVASPAHKILIDHHLAPSDFCEVMMSYTEVCSTSELVYRFIDRLGKAQLINHQCAECIYTGMMTDTGSFTYNSNRNDIYLIVSELIQKGIDKDLIYRRVNQVYSEARLRLEGYVLYEKMKIYPDKHTSLITLSNEELKRFDYHSGDTEGFVNLPLSIDDVVFSVFIREDEDYIKISLRSVGDFPCNLFAKAYFGGGGHKNASGGEFYGSLEDAVKTFEQGLKEFNPEMSAK